MPNLKPETKRVVQKELQELDAQIEDARREVETTETHHLKAKEKLRDLQRRKTDLIDDLA